MLEGKIKDIYRLFRYKNERNKFIREFGLRKTQNQLLRENYFPEVKKLIVFIIPGSDWATGKDKITGGTISIVSLCEETAALNDIHGAQTLMCTMNGDHLLIKHSMFENKTMVFRFEQLADYFTSLDSILFHLPEFMVSHFVKKLNQKDKIWLKRAADIHINVMNQNIRLMPEPAELGGLKNISTKVTITTAHQKYCTQYYREYFGVPLHKFSVWISPEQYHFKSWKEKKNLLVVSPDGHPLKEEIIQQLRSIPNLEIQVIQNLTYKAYKELIADAKWSLTFGEGLDGYLIEPVFSGAVGFAVFNEQFFTPDFKDLKTVFKSVEVLKAQICEKIAGLDNESDFEKYQEEQFNLCAKYYSMEQYRKNIAAFYKDEFTFG